MLESNVFDLKLFWYCDGWVGGWLVGRSGILILRLTQFNCYCNCQLELSLAIKSQDRLSLFFIRRLVLAVIMLHCPALQLVSPLLLLPHPWNIRPILNWKFCCPKLNDLGRGSSTICQASYLHPCPGRWTWQWLVSENITTIYYMLHLVS